MLFTKPIDQVNWIDVEEFCRQGIKEGAFLEYKEDFPKNLEKTLSAMANTIGGIVLIGVEETDENRPILPIKGINFQRGLEEKVINIILSNITPIFIPEVSVCKNEINNKAVIVIRISESHQSPHAIDSNKKVYIRTGNVNTPEELASVEEVLWLTSHRKKSIELKNQLLEQSINRYEYMCSRVMRESEVQGKDIQIRSKGLLTISCCPTFPSSQFANPNKLREIVNKISVPDPYNTYSSFPYNDIFSNNGNGILTQDGLMFIRTFGGNRIFHTEINSFGFVFYRQPINRKQRAYLQSEWLFCSELITRIDILLKFLSIFYNELGFWGNIDLNISLSEIKNQYLWLDFRKSEVYEGENGICPDNEIDYSIVTTLSKLHEIRDKILFESVQKICWGFDIEFSNMHLKSYYRSYL